MITKSGNSTNLETAAAGLVRCLIIGVSQRGLLEFTHPRTGLALARDGLNGPWGNQELRTGARLEAGRQKRSG